MGKKRYFKFYTAYYDEMMKLFIFQRMKLIKALCEYAEYGSSNQRLGKKAERLYKKIIAIDTKERIFYQTMGKKGSKKRWNENPVKNGL